MYLRNLHILQLHKFSDQFVTLFVLRNRRSASLAKTRASCLKCRRDHDSRRKRNRRVALWKKNKQKKTLPASNVAPIPVAVADAPAISCAFAVPLAVVHDAHSRGEGAAEWTARGDGLRRRTGTYTRVQSDGRFIGSLRTTIELVNVET